MTTEIGRRERKKAQTRKAIGDAALRLFLDRGYDRVGVREVADAADVSVTTLFNYFPSKEALVFDSEEEIEAALVAAVRDRPHGRSIPRALRDYIIEWATEVSSYPHAAAYTRLIEDTPALRDYARRIWLRHEAALSQAIADAAHADPGDVTCTALARFVLEVLDLAPRHADPARAVDQIFALLERGWTATHAEA